MNRIIQYIKEQFDGEQNRWFLWMPVLFALGIVLYFQLPQELSIWWTLGVLEALILFAILFRHHIKVLIFLMIVGVVSLGFANIQLKATYLNKTKEIKSPELTYISGMITKIDYNYRGMQRFLLKDTSNFEQNRNFGTVKVSTRMKKSDFKVGQCVEMAANLMPAGKPVIIGGYQFDRKAYFEEIDANGFAMSSVYEIDCQTKPSFAEKFNFYIDELRAKIIDHIRSILPPDKASIAAAIVAGEQGVISRKVIQDYRDSGLAHFLSISGLHMTMIAGLMFFFVRLFMAFIPPLALRYDSKKPAAVMAILISIFYLFISGAQVPAQRAFIMNLIVVLGIFVGRKAISMRTISWAAMFILFFSPQALIGASFQMSFAAVVALIAFYEKYAGALQHFLRGNPDSGKTVKFFRYIWAYLVGILLADFIASLATTPFAIYHFNKIALYTSLTNLLAGPIIGLIVMPLVLLALILMPFGLDVIPFKLVGWGIGIINDITAYVAALPNSGYQVLSMPTWGFALIILGGLWLCLWNMPWRKWGVVVILVGVLSIFTVKVPDVMVDNEASLLAIKDEQGDLVILPARGNNFTKQMWLEKTANKKLDEKERRKLYQIYRGKKMDKSWLDLECDKKSCLYKNRIRFYKDKRLEIDGKKFDTYHAEGASIYFEKDGIKIKTIRDFIGSRYWNK